MKVQCADWEGVGSAQGIGGVWRGGERSFGLGLELGLGKNRISVQLNNSSYYQLIKGKITLFSSSMLPSNNEK